MNIKDSGGKKWREMVKEWEDFPKGGIIPILKLSILFKKFNIFVNNFSPYYTLYVEFSYIFPMYLNDFKCTVTSTEGVTTISHLNETVPRHIYEVRYEGENSVGSLTYERVKLKGQVKPLVQDIIVLVKSDMNSVIDEINSKKPLNENDLILLQLEMRNHSREKINSHHH